MKNLLLFAVLSVTTITTVFSQNYRLIEWDILGVSQLWHTEAGIGNAIAFNSELRGNIYNRLSVGLKYEWQFTDIYARGVPVRGLGTNSLYALTIDYYVFNSVNKRAFAGLAIGNFNNEATTYAGDTIGGKKIGLVPRIGYEPDYYFRITAEYNFTAGDDFPDYFVIGIALNIGGRYKA